MKAIFTGTICSGFSFMQIVFDVKAPGIVAAYLGKGILAEALEVRDPVEKDKRFELKNLDNANLFVVFGKLGGGFELFGPFNDKILAGDFGEIYRGEDGDWELFECKTGLGTAG